MLTNQNNRVCAFLSKASEKTQDWVAQVAHLLVNVFLMFRSPKILQEDRTKSSIPSEQRIIQ